MAEERRWRPNCDRSTPRGQSRTPENDWPSSILSVEGEGHRVRSVLVVSYHSAPVLSSDALGVKPGLKAPHDRLEPGHAKEGSIRSEIATRSAWVPKASIDENSRVVARHYCPSYPRSQSWSPITDPVLARPSELHRHERLRAEPDGIDKVYDIRLLQDQLCTLCHDATADSQSL